MDASMASLPGHDGGEEIRPYKIHVRLTRGRRDRK